MEFSTPPRKTAPPTRYTNTPVAYQERCPGIPNVRQSRRIVAAEADFRYFSHIGNTMTVIDWMIHKFSHRRQVVLGKVLSMETNDKGGIDFFYDDKEMKEFVAFVCTGKRYGILPCSILHAEEMEGHALLCVWDARSSSSQLNVYFVDSNGREDSFSRPFVNAARGFFRNMIKWLTHIRMKPSSYEAHTYTLRTPVMNSYYSPYMEKRDEEEGISIRDTREGFCGPWMYVYVLDILCSKQLFLTRDHFYRMYEQAGGTHPSEEERDYTRLMYLRNVLSWIANEMFDPQDKMYKQTIKEWVGKTPFGGAKRALLLEWNVYMDVFV